MRFVSVRDLRSRSAELWRDLPDEREMVITSNGRPVALLVAIDESNFEESISAFRRARAVEAVARLQRDSTRRGTDGVSDEEIEAEITAVRRERRTRATSRRRVPPGETPQHPASPAGGDASSR
ncbi:MAG: type II toxin-antitoxin system Phd/YefM family antitoxin [Actinobacteria bacterium]|nr:type II toxin-antitoxin system Phd/YefM family antitoxin [Actinomycetota bacterium]